MCRPNEELDDKAVIKKLKKRVSELEKELISIRENKTLPPQVKFLNSIFDIIALEKYNRFNRRSYI